MNQLQQTLTELWPFYRATVKCKVCGEELYDTKKNPPSIDGPAFLSKLIEIFSMKHDSRSGHHSIDIYVEPVEVVEEIEAEVTIKT